MEKLMLFTSLLVVTESGAVSLIKDLDQLTCKKLACELGRQRICFPSKCDDKGNTIRLEYPSNTCILSKDDARPKTIQCLD